MQTESSLSFQLSLTRWSSWKSTKRFLYKVLLMSCAQATQTWTSLIIACFLSVRRYGQPSLSSTRSEEPQCHPGRCRAQPCGHQCHLCKYGLFCPRSNRHPQETAKPHGGSTLRRSWYRVIMCLWIVFSDGTQTCRSRIQPLMFILKYILRMIKTMHFSIYNYYKYSGHILLNTEIPVIY